MDAGAALGTGLGTALAPVSAPAGTPPPGLCLLFCDEEAAGLAAAAGFGAGALGLGPALNMSSMWAVLDCALPPEEEEEAAAGALKKSARPSGVAAWGPGGGG